LWPNLLRGEGLRLARLHSIPRAVQLAGLEILLDLAAIELVEEVPGVELLLVEVPWWHS
jgi:hypothetical protein